MATFVTTVQFTERGTQAVRDTCRRAAAFQEAANKLGVKVSGVYWTLGPFDGVMVFEAPDEATARQIMAEDPVLAGGYARGELRPFRVSLLRGRD
jgi:uncharacterized protein with GYD domain